MAIVDEASARQEVAKLSSELRYRRPKIEEWIGYYKGEQGQLRFASAEFKQYFEKRYAGFVDNWCMPVAQAPAERMKLLGIRLNRRNQKADREFDRVLKANEGEREASEAFQLLIAASRAFILVSPNARDNATPFVTFEHPSQAIVNRDPMSRERRSGLIVWTDDKWDYGTLYTPDAVWKYQRATGRNRGQGRNDTPTTLDDAWVPRESRTESWPAPNPLGVVPLVEMRNQSLLDDEPMSDIAGVAAMQDAVNLVWAYLLNGLDYATLPQRVVTGADVPKVPVLGQDGQITGHRPVELDELIRERIAFIPGENARTSEWSSANLDAFSKVIEHAIEHIAAQTRTPPHYLIARMVNTAAESMTVAEAGLVSKTRERVAFVNPAVREMYRLIALAQGNEGRARAAQGGEVVWDNIQYRSEAQRADALLKKRQIGYPLEYLLEEDGVGPGEIQRILDMREREAQMDPTAAIARGLADTGSDANGG